MFGCLSWSSCMLFVVKAELTSSSRSTAGREMAVGTGAHVGSGTEPIATWIPTDCWREKKKESLDSSTLVLSPVCAFWPKTIKSWKDLRTIHWFPPDRVFQPGQQYEWKREPHTLGLLDTRKMSKQTYCSPFPTHFNKKKILTKYTVIRLSEYTKQSWTQSLLKWWMKVFPGIKGKGGYMRGPNIRKNVLLSFNPEL